MRLFIALDVPEPVIAALADVQKRIQRTGNHPVKWSSPEGFHMTLQFLGEVEDALIPSVLSALKRIEEHTLSAPMWTFPRLRLAHVSAFPNLRRPQTIWVGVDGDMKRLRQIHQAVTRELTLLGFPDMTERFHAHFTLGRVRRHATPQELTILGNAVGDTTSPESVTWTTGAPILFHSTLTPEGAIYRRIHYANNHRAT